MLRLGGGRLCRRPAGAQAAVELVYTGIEPPIVRRLNALRLIGTFDVAGPDEGRFDPFWQLAAQGQEVLTVRRPNGPDTPVTTLPIILNSEVLREFLASIQRELNSRGLAPLRLAKRDGLVIRASYVGEVPAVEAAVKSLLHQRGLAEGCDLHGRCHSACASRAQQLPGRTPGTEQVGHRWGVLCGAATRTRCSWNGRTADPDSADPLA